MLRRFRLIVGTVALSSCIAVLARAQQPPTSWVDKDTGHRIFRLTNEPGSFSFYFNVNAYWPDGKLMAYNAPDGIHVLNFTTMKTRLIVPNPPRAADTAPGTLADFRNGVHTIVVGRRTSSVFFSKVDPATRLSTI